MSPDMRLYVQPSVYRREASTTMLRASLEPSVALRKAQEKFYEFFGTYRASVGKTVSQLGPVLKARHEARQSTSVRRFQFSRTKHEGSKVSEKERHSMWEKSAQNMVKDMHHDKQAKLEGLAVARGKTIFGTEYPDQSRVLPRTAYQKATIKACKVACKQAREEFVAEERDLGYSRSVRPVVINHRLKVPKVVPRFAAAKLAVAKALVSQKLASANRSCMLGKKWVDRQGHAHVRINWLNQVIYNWRINQT